MILYLFFVQYFFNLQNLYEYIYFKIRNKKHQIFRIDVILNFILVTLHIYWLFLDIFYLRAQYPKSNTKYFYTEAYKVQLDNINITGVTAIIVGVYWFKIIMIL